MRATFRALLSLAVAALPGAGGAPSQAQQPVFGANVELVLLSVGVFDGAGVPVPGLTAADFRIEEDGEEREVGLAMTAAGAPLDIALALDLSGSMVNSPWRQRAAGFLGSLNARTDCVFMMGFSGGVGGSMWGRPDDPSFIASLERTTVGGGTALNDAAVAATAELAISTGADLSDLFADVGETFDPTGESPARPPILRRGDCPLPIEAVDSSDPTARRRRAVIVVSDGEDSGSSASAAQVERVAQAAGLPIFHLQVAAPAGRGRAGMGGGRSLRGRPASSPGGFRRVVESTGGISVRASEQAYLFLLERLRSYYTIGYYVPRRDTGTVGELTRHEVRAELVSRPGEVVHPHVTYRPTVDHVRARAEAAEAHRRLLAEDLDGALFAVEAALAANPRYGPGRAYHALVLERLGRHDEARSEAAAAARLAPGDIEIYRLAARLLSDGPEPERAWEPAIQAAQAGADMFDMFSVLAKRSSVPEGFIERLEAPKVAVVFGDSREQDLFARAALPKAVLAIRNAIADAPMLALVGSERDAAFVVRVADGDVEDEPPRKFEGRITLDERGEELYDKGFELDALDDPSTHGPDLARHIEEIAKKVGGRR